MQILCQGKLWKCIFMLRIVFLCGKSRNTCQGISASSTTFCLDFGVGKVLPIYGNADKREERALAFSGGYIIAPEYNGKNWKRK